MCFLAPGSSPTIVSVTALSAHILSVLWSDPLSTDINGIIQSYLVNVSITETMETFLYKTNNTFLLLNDVHPYYTYSVMVAAVTIAPGPFTSEYSVTTPQDGELMKYHILINYYLLFFSSKWVPSKCNSYCTEFNHHIFVMGPCISS